MPDRKIKDRTIDSMRSVMQAAKDKKMGFLKDLV
jgi:hypothetical protein